MKILMVIGQVEWDIQSESVRHIFTNDVKLMQNDNKAAIKVLV